MLGPAVALWAGVAWLGPAVAVALATAAYAPIEAIAMNTVVAKRRGLVERMNPPLVWSIGPAPGAILWPGSRHH
jgi:hypothetical protein